MRLLVVDRVNRDVGCWLADGKYPKMGKEKIHQKFAAGSGPVVRHLCSERNCINPMHLVRGTAAENNKDEDEKNIFMVEVANNAMKDFIHIVVFKPNDIESTILNFICWRLIVHKDNWDREDVRMHLETYWKDEFKRRVLDGFYRRYLGLNIVGEQETSAYILMSWIERNRRITILEVA